MARPKIHLTDEARRAAHNESVRRQRARAKAAKILPGVTGPVELLEALLKNEVERKAILEQLEAAATRLRAESALNAKVLDQLMDKHAPILQQLSDHVKTQGNS